MAAQQQWPDYSAWCSSLPLEAEIIPSDLSRSGKAYLEKIALALEDVAPKPGLLVYITAAPLSLPMNGLEPVLFSAVDVSTHLQVAQAYHSPTIASAVSFVEFAASSFPFPLSQIRTCATRPFCNGNHEASHRDFSVLIGRMGYIHSPVADPERDALFSITSKVHFKHLTGGSALPTAPFDLQREIGQYLFFHNNYRTIPWLGSKTPVQRLRSFERFSRIHSFSTLEERDAALRPDMRRVERKRATK